ncbi:hypothetical protein FOPG_18918, partial [Fusarium oxysporum f. sp. conglutinans race 2 54008]
PRSKETQILVRSQFFVKVQGLGGKSHTYSVTGLDPCTAEVRESVNFEA